MWPRDLLTIEPITACWHADLCTPARGVHHLPTCPGICCLSAPITEDWLGGIVAFRNITDGAPPAAIIETHIQSTGMLSEWSPISQYVVPSTEEAVAIELEETSELLPRVQTPDGWLTYVMQLVEMRRVLEFMASASGLEQIMASTVCVLTKLEKVSLSFSNQSSLPIYPVFS